MSFQCPHCGSRSFTLAGAARLVSTDDFDIDAAVCRECGTSFDTRGGPNRLKVGGGGE